MQPHDTPEPRERIEIHPLGLFAPFQWLWRGLCDLRAQ
ncbi:MAG: hypothetical protein RLZ36_726, partial [Pseudomonadota bacterium]